MHGVQISYLIEHPEYVPRLAQWLFEQWDFIRGEKNAETRIEELREHMNRDELPIAWVAHGNGQLFGTAALRVDGPEGREDLTPWLCPEARLTSCSVFRQTASMEAEIDCKLQSSSS
jgi:hypothetical protein